MREDRGALLRLGRLFWQEDKDNDPALHIIGDAVVRVRKPQPCCGEPVNSPLAHSCPQGGLAYREKAVFEGRWVSAYVCEACLLASGDTS